LLGTQGKAGRKSEIRESEFTRRSKLASLRAAAEKLDIHLKEHPRADAEVALRKWRRRCAMGASLDGSAGSAAYRNPGPTSGSCWISPGCRCPRSFRTGESACPPDENRQRDIKTIKNQQVMNQTPRFKG
jgi:hypothetical protein